jgi:hypothetical protein
MNDRPPSWRKLTEAEKRVLDRLLAGEFAGKHELAAQAELATVSRIDGEGSLQLRTKGPDAPVTQRIPVEGSYLDGSSDTFGPVVHLLLHVVEGRLQELEIYKNDGSDIVVGPFEISPDQIEIWTK